MQPSKPRSHGFKNICDATNMDEQLGTYRLIGRLGAGGMGEVHRAHDAKLSRDVAIKLLPRELADDPERRARLLREARAAAALNHPNICTIHDVGEAGGRRASRWSWSRASRSAIALAGGRRRWTRSFDTGCSWLTRWRMRTRHGVVHRDLKSANVMVMPSGRLKVLDFGLAKRAIGDELGDLTTRDSLTHDGAVLGHRAAYGARTTARTRRRRAH